VALREARLVERELELGALGRLIESARSGAGGTVVVEGPPGIGKSSLLAAARAAAGDDWRVVGALGSELEREFPFGVVRQLLEPVLAAAGGVEREGLLAGAAALAEPVLLGSGGAAGAEPSFAALHGLYWLAVNLAGERPLLVLVDDVHWADLASLRWLVYLAPAPRCRRASRSWGWGRSACPCPGQCPRRGPPSRTATQVELHRTSNRFNAFRWALRPNPGPSG
jgi:AAA ATPase domain